MLFASLFEKLRSHPQPGPSRTMISPPLGSSQWVLFYLFPRVGAPPKLGNFEYDDDAQKSHRYLHFFPQNTPNPVFFEVRVHVFAMFSFKTR